MKKDGLKERIWWNYLQEDLRELFSEAVHLYEVAVKWEENYHDYAFIVFPAAKAYEGFLKNVFKDMSFISSEEFYGKRFRVGKALNPSLDRDRYKDESVYDKLKLFCGNENLPNKMWNIWKRGRNLTFHWFPNERNAITLDEAREILDDIFDTMDETFEGCKINK